MPIGTPFRFFQSMMKSIPEQSIQFAPLGSRPIEELLGLVPPPLVAKDLAFKQLRRVEEYVRDPELGCTTVAIEEHYVDRDFMEDHSAFYGRSLPNYHNFCKRIHFFSGDPNQVESELRQLVTQSRGLSQTDFREQCAKFSRERYYGFCVIKPLWGTPVGRTVLRTFPSPPRDNQGRVRTDVERLFYPTRPYTAHLLGAELSVKGLAFQQQDIGVAACATTAVWTSLQQFRDQEEIGIMTPALITTRATHARLPFGRSMPSEGLSIDQMCQAVQAFNVSPVLNPAPDFFSARAQLYSACRSGLAPVMVISNEARTRHHAIVAVGMKLGSPNERTGDLHNHVEDRLIAVYVHDDRYGPYLRSELRRVKEGLQLKIRTRINSDGTDETEEWFVTHILTPTHHKIRLAFSDLQELSTRIVKAIGPSWDNVRQRRGLSESDLLEYGVWILRASTYLERMAREDFDFDPQIAIAIGSHIALSRYVGILRLSIPPIGIMDVLFDTTSTSRNTNFLAVVCGRSLDEDFRKIARALSEGLDCPLC